MEVKGDLKMNMITINDIIEISSVTKKNIFGKTKKSSLEIEMKFLNDSFWICYIDGIRRKKSEKYILYKADCIETEQSFNTIEALFEKGKLENKLLKDIWDNIEIVAINSCDPIEYITNYRKHRKITFNY